MNSYTWIHLFYQTGKNFHQFCMDTVCKQRIILKIYNCLQIICIWQNYLKTFLCKLFLLRIVAWNYTYLHMVIITIICYLKPYNCWQKKKIDFGIK